MPIVASMGVVAGSIPVVVRVDGSAAAVPAPPARYAHGPLPVTGVELVLVPLAVLTVAAGALLRRAARS